MPRIRGTRALGVVPTAILVLAIAFTAGASAQLKRPMKNKTPLSPLVFGTDGQFSGPTSDPSSELAVQAFFNAWNRQGGYKGHPVELAKADSGTTATTDLAAEQQLISGDNVLALVGSDGPDDCSAGASLIESAGIASIADPTDTGCFTVPDVFPTRPPSIGALGPVLDYAFKKGDKRVCELYPDIPTSVAALQAGVGGLLKSFGKGGKLAYFDVYPLAPSAADASAFVAAIQQNHCNVALVSETVAATQQILQAAQQAGIYPHKGVLMIATNVYNPAAPAALGSAGVGVIADSFTEPLPSKVTRKTPTELQQALKVLRNVPPANRDTYAALGYEDAWLLEYTLYQIKGPVTRASILAKLKSLKSVTLPLQPTPFDFHQANVSATNPWKVPEGGGVVQINARGGFTTLDNWVVAP